MVKNPLRKRIPRELRGDFGKYAVIFLLLTFTIAVVSGFLVADGSMIQAYNEGFEKYNIENGNFRVKNKLNKAQKKIIEAEGVRLYDNFYTEEALTNGTTLRMFAIRQEVNTPCVLSGALPSSGSEIAIDRMYAENNGLSIGDEISSPNGTWRISGLVALPDYSCLFQDNADAMFDSLQFGVALVNGEGFVGLEKTGQVHYSYSWLYDVPPAEEREEKELSEDLMAVLNQEASLEDFVPRYLNQAITFTGEDMGSDRAMVIALLYIVIAIMAFVFAVTIGNTISKEANVIGTLLASGYTKRELIRHYMTCPILICLISAVVGNVLGYTVLKDFCAGLYYGSYSLPTYVTIWNGEAFVLTTVVPLVLMTVITWWTLRKKLGLSPLQFLRRDLRKKQKNRVFPLPKGLPFFFRFRLRVIFQNLGSYVILFVGILFANLLLMFGLLFPSALSHYQETMPENMLSKNTTMLSVPASAVNEKRKLESYVNLMLFMRDVETDVPGAEKFSAYSLETTYADYKSEAVTLYGVSKDSGYIHADLPKGSVLISAAYQEKYDVQPGDTVTLKEKYEDKTYSFTVTGVYDYMGGLTLFLPREDLNTTFDLGKDYFCGYFSEKPITDIDPEYIGTVLDETAVTKISRQLMRSMGDLMGLVNLFAEGMFMVIVYLLSKMIIEKNAISISMAKILGYSRWEIFRLYVLPTTIVTLAMILLSLPIETAVMDFLFRAVMMSAMTGWIPVYIAPDLYIKMAGYGFATYGIVALLELRRIGKIPESEALKCVE